MESNKSEICREIDILEKKFKFTFPENLKKFYIENNFNSFHAFTFFVGDYECGVAKIIPIITNGLSFEKIVDGDRKDQIIPETYFPIARDRGGNLYYWDANTGNVYLLMNDDIENPFLVFSCVTDFLNCVIAHQQKNL